MESGLDLNYIMFGMCLVNIAADHLNWFYYCRAVECFIHGPVDAKGKGRAWFARMNMAPTRQNLSTKKTRGNHTFIVPIVTWLILDGMEIHGKATQIMKESLLGFPEWKLF